MRYAFDRPKPGDLLHLDVRTNVVDLAVGVVIGAAFGKVVQALSKVC